MSMRLHIRNMLNFIDVYKQMFAFEINLLDPAMHVNAVFKIKFL